MRDFRGPNRESVWRWGASVHLGMDITLLCHYPAFCYHLPCCAFNFFFFFRAFPSLSRFFCALTLLCPLIFCTLTLLCPLNFFSRLPPPRAMPRRLTSPWVTP